MREKISRQFSIGTRTGFGIDLNSWRSMPRIFGCVTLWIRGEALGRDDNPEAVYPLLTVLEFHLAHSDVNFASDVLGVDTTEAWERIKAVDNRYRMASAEFFDDYEMYCVSDQQVVRFLWKHRVGDQGNLHDALLPRDEVLRSIQELRNVYETLARMHRDA